MSYTVLSDTGPHEIREYENNEDREECLKSRCTMGDLALLLDYRSAWVFPAKKLYILDEKGAWHLYFNQPAWYEDSREQKVARVQIHGWRHEQFPMTTTFFRPERDYSFPWEQVCLLGKQRTEIIESREDI